jgi:hypothetical protein
MEELGETRVGTGEARVNTGVREHLTPEELDEHLEERVFDFEGPC